MEPNRGQEPGAAGIQLKNRLRAVLAEDVFISDDRIEEGRLVVAGQLRPGATYDTVRAACERAGFTPLMRKGASGSVEITVIPSVSKPVAQNRWINVALLIATIATTVVAGAQTAEGVDVGQGLLFSAGLMGPLIAHELGHLLVSRIRRVPASWPYFIPLPLPSVPGTLGAVMVQREPWKNRRTLLEVAVAGPLAGFLVAVPLFFVGAALSTVEAYAAPPQGMVSLFFGDSLMTGLIGQLTKGPVWFMSDPVVNLNMLGLGAWFALLFTGLNLIPAGQLDGGHIAYALLGDSAKYVSWVCIAALLGLALFVSNVLMLWAILLFLFGRSHPPVLDDTASIDAPRLMLVVIGVAILVLTFVPQPITILGG